MIPHIWECEIADELSVAVGGMCGFLLPAEGDPCPTVVPTPFKTLGGDIGSNATCSAFYANPPHQKHIARPLEGQGFEVPDPFVHSGKLTCLDQCLRTHCAYQNIVMSGLSASGRQKAQVAACLVHDSV